MKKYSFILFIFISSSSLFASTDSLFSLFQNYGKYSVGFKRIYEFDSTRKYPMQFNPKINNDTGLTNRPMIINVWYPCNKKTLTKSTYSEYLTFNPPNSSWNNFINRIVDFNKETIINNVFKRTPLNDTIEEINLFNTFLKMETQMYLNVEEINQEFPLIIAQPGLGGSIEENALLYEFLASHGYYVVSCAYQSNEGKIMHPDWNLERSFKDVEFLKNYSKSHFKIKNNNIHLMGFSFGAQSNFNILLKDHSFRSAVSFDSRFESQYNYDPRGYNHLPKRLLENNKDFITPILLITNQTAPYLIPDSLLYSNRNYIMVKDYKHYDFTSIKEMGFLLISKKKNNSYQQNKVSNYSILANQVLLYLNHYSSNKNTESFHFPKIENKDFWFEEMKKNESRPMLLLNENTTPRRALLSIERLGIESIIKKYPEYKNVFTENMLNDYAYYLIDKQNISLSIKVLLWANKLFLGSFNLYDSLGEVYFIQRDYQKSLSAYNMSLSYNSQNNNAIKMINKINSLIEKN